MHSARIFAGILLASSLALSGCGTSAASSTESAASEQTVNQADGLRALLVHARATTDAEPADDVTDGTYLAILDEITTDEEMDVTSVAFDLVTGKAVVAKAADFYNEKTHRQTLPIAEDAVLAVPDEAKRFLVVPTAEFGTRWREDATVWVPYYIVIEGGEAKAIWPVALQ